MKKLVCTSCSKEILNDIGSTTFTCPACGKAKIIRCKNCREIGAKYKCKSCNFEGPN
ncbi:MAG: DUF1610 domain-containing protein [Nanoarchaeota archaeon]|nr:DUF1610 domain-containing protein [Nanoarchaeota archaeon]